MKNTIHKAAVLRRIRRAWLLAGLTGLVVFNGVAQAVCNDKMPLTRPDSRYDEVTGSSGAEVRDKVTGLIWQRCVVGMSWNGATCTGTASSLTWQNALDAARTASKSTVLGATAWRAPNYAELRSLSELACLEPAINTTWFPATPPNETWSSSTVATLLNHTAWSIHFGRGDTVPGLGSAAGSAFRVRLVRSGQ